VFVRPSQGSAGLLQNGTAVRNPSRTRPPHGGPGLTRLVVRDSGGGRSGSCGGGRPRPGSASPEGVPPATIAWGPSSPMRLMATTGRPRPRSPRRTCMPSGLRQQQVKHDDVGKQLQIETPGARRGPGSQSTSQHGMGSLDRGGLIERHADQRFRCSERVWSPPPESNRRPHPYHGTTRNRCADRRSPGHARPSGSRLSVLFRPSYAFSSRAKRPRRSAGSSTGAHGRLGLHGSSMVVSAAGVRVDVRR
jgi:hypothetical protein